MPLSHLAERVEGAAARPAAARALRRRLPLVDRRQPAAAAGFEDVSELAGGIAAWEAAGLPIANAAAL